MYISQHLVHLRFWDDARREVALHVSGREIVAAVKPGSVGSSCEAEPEFDRLLPHDLREVTCTKVKVVHTTHKQDPTSSQSSPVWPENPGYPKL